MTPFQRIGLSYAYFIVVWCLIWIPMRFLTVNTFPFRNTYQLPSDACTQTLVTDFWSYDWVREQLVVLYNLYPLSICFMLFTREKVGFWQHVLIMFLVLALGLMTFISDIPTLIYANVPPSDPNFNIANMARSTQWCLYYGGQPGTEFLCTYVGNCTGAAVDPETFGIYWYFLLRVVCNGLLTLLLVIDLGYMMAWFKLIAPTTTTPQQVGNYPVYKIKK